MTMPKFGRRNLRLALQTAALGVAALDLVVYLALARPLASAVRSEQEKFSSARSQVRAKEAQLARLQKSLAELPDTDEELKEFLSQHVPPRRRGFSRAAGMVRQFTQDAGIQLTGVAYRLGSDRNAPLERLGIQVTVEGPFQSLLRFTHAMETANDFVLVRGLAFQPGESGGLALRLLADLYVTP
jgi:Tfp pilus assembly protein PilO